MRETLPDTILTSLGHVAASHVYSEIVDLYLKILFLFRGLIAGAERFARATEGLGLARCHLSLEILRLYLETQQFQVFVQGLVNTLFRYFRLDCYITAARHDGSHSELV